MNTYWLRDCPLFMVILFCVASRVSAGDDDRTEVKPPNEVAGRSFQQWTVDLGNENEFVRLRAVKSLGPFGVAAIDALVQSLDDDSAGVRYWAASHLGAIGRQATVAVGRLKEVKSDKRFPDVAMAAAFALCRIEALDGNIEVLIERLESPERGMACSAAEFIGRLGPDGRVAIPALENAFAVHDKRPAESGKPPADYHVRGAVQNALRLIQPDWKPKS